MTTNQVLKEEKKQINQLLPANCRWFATSEAPTDFNLYPKELEITSKMATKRLNEFRASRYCARQVLKACGVTEFPLLPNEHRAPNWPSGTIGSISHTEGRCLAVASQAKNLRSIGIDVELSEPLKPDLMPQIITSKEEKQLLQTNSPLKNAKLIFSIKESVFKCLHPVFHTWIGFKDVSVWLDFNSTCFSITQENQISSHLPFSQLKGSWYFSGSFIYTCCWLEQELNQII